MGAANAATSEATRSMFMVGSLRDGGRVGRQAGDDSLFGSRALRGRVGDSMSRSRLALIAALLAVLPATSLAAERPSLDAPLASGPIRVDGARDEPAWGVAPVASAFALMSPREGQAPDESTTVRVVRDGERIVFGIWCQAKRRPHASLVPRDQVLDGDHISVHIDTDGDGQRAYIFGVNPYGVQLDGILTGDPDF